MKPSKHADRPATDAQIACRYCGGTDVRPSSKTSRGAGHVVYRCRACHKHFKVETRAPRPRVILYAAGALLLLTAGAGLYLARGPTSGEAPSIEAAEAESLAALRTRAGKGDPQAQYELGRALWHRDNFTEALHWLQNAADRGRADAQYMLGQAYQYGYGTVQNFRAAQAQYLKAAEQGHLEAEYRLGLFYRDGLAGPVDKRSAYIWLNVAAAKGHDDALVLRDKLTQSMGGEEILQAQEASGAVLARVKGQATPAARP
ncbi:MAG TPA: tetratricopeptide repeat protein [Thiobacillaceae bacterium]|nr:tetratricopeptide repeat protein [Thiobacillaceae bacterium]HNU64849.1 tetratricopeptide repeat protein [Thiobacillaceae bacterium]